MDLIVGFGNMSTKYSVFTTVYKRERHQLGRKAAGHGGDDSSKRAGTFPSLYLSHGVER